MNTHFFLSVYFARSSCKEKICELQRPCDLRTSITRGKQSVRRHGPLPFSFGKKKNRPWVGGRKDFCVSLAYCGLTPEPHCTAPLPQDNGRVLFRGMWAREKDGVPESGCWFLSLTKRKKKYLFWMFLFFPTRGGPLNGQRMTKEAMAQISALSWSVLHKAALSSDPNNLNNLAEDICCYHFCNKHSLSLWEHGEELQGLGLYNGLPNRNFCKLPPCEVV